MLSAQCTDVRVNEVTIALFERFPTPQTLAAAPRDELEQLIYPTGFFRTKADHLLGLGAVLCERFGGQVPKSLADLQSLPGVGKKTANVVRSVAFGLPGLAVDTHVLRLSRRLGLTRATEPVGVERSLCRALPPTTWGAFSVRMILHGRATCTARRPACDACVLEDLCPRRGVPTPARRREASDLALSRSTRRRVEASPRSMATNSSSSSRGTSLPAPSTSAVTRPNSSRSDAPSAWRSPRSCTMR